MLAEISSPMPHDISMALSMRSNTLIHHALHRWKGAKKYLSINDKLIRFLNLTCGRQITDLRRNKKIWSIESLKRIHYDCFDYVNYKWQDEHYASGLFDQLIAALFWQRVAWKN